MSKFEYRVVPAPTKASKFRGIRDRGEKFARTVEELMNEMGADGWEYLRADTLPAEERQGLTSKTTVFQNMLVFRRPMAAEAAKDVEPKTIAANTPSEPLALPAPPKKERAPKPAKPHLYSALALRAAQIRSAGTAAE